MKPSVPNAKNWPEDPRKRRLRVLRSKIRAIDQNTPRDAVGELVRLTREFRRNGQRLDGFVAAYKVREKDGTIAYRMSARGNVGLPEQIALARSLNAWLEDSKS